MESHPLYRLKNHTVVSCRLSSCKTGVYNVRLLIILDRGCSSMYRKIKLLSHGQNCMQIYSCVQICPCEWICTRMQNLHDMQILIFAPGGDQVQI